MTTTVPSAQSSTSSDRRPPGGLAGKSAIVTGSGGGNGAAIATALCRHGARVVCADIDGAAAARTAESLRSHGAEAVHITADHTISSDCSDTVALALATFGSLDVLVNNAGSATVGTALEVTENGFLDLLRINVLGPMLMSQAALPAMIEQGAGSIVMIASIAGVAARPAQAAYVVSKHALVGLMRSLAVDFARHGVRVNAICPEFIRTPMTASFVRQVATRHATSADEAVRVLGEVFPLGRLGDPADVAAAAVHFASDDSAWTTGQTYVLDGGLSLVRPQSPRSDRSPGAGVKPADESPT